MMTTEDPVVRLTSGQHSAALVASLNIMLQDEILLDCSLICDGRMIRAHRVILSASCGYFRTAFTSFPSSACQNTAIIINDISFHDLKTIIDFIYEGDVGIERSRIPSLLKSSQCLQVKSLCAQLSSILAAATTIPPQVTAPLSSATTGSAIPNSSLQILQQITVATASDKSSAPRHSWQTTGNSPIICQALTGVRMDVARVSEHFECNDVLAQPRVREVSRKSELKHEDQYSSSEEIDIPEAGVISASIPCGVVLSEDDDNNERAPVDLSSNASNSDLKRYHVKPRDFYANGTLSRQARAGSFTMGQTEEQSRVRKVFKGLSSENGRTSSHSSVDPGGCGEVGVRSDSLSSGENVTLKRGRGRPPRHSLDDEMRVGENRMGSDVVPAQLMDEVLGYKRLKLNSQGLPASVRGRKPKLSYSGSREISGKNKCPCCPQVYYSTQAMNDHISNVHSKNALKYGCKFCAKEFSWKISLNKHLRKQHPQDTCKSPATDLRS